MRHTSALFGCLFLLALPSAAQDSRAPAALPATPPAQMQGTQIDGIAAHIEDDIITDSEVQELARYQELVNGKAQTRKKLLNELLDQWVVRREAAGLTFPQPAQESVDGEFQRLAGKFSSREAFEAKLQELGLDDAAVKREIARQMYLSQFLEYRFRPGVQVSDAEVETYYQKDFARKLRAEKQPVPPLDAVEGKIQDLLTEEQVSKRADEWMNDARSRLHIEVSQEQPGCTAQPGTC